MTVNLYMAASKFRLTGELTEAEMNELQIPSIAKATRSPKTSACSTNNAQSS